MLVLGDDVLVGGIGVDLIDPPRLPALLKSCLLIWIADRDVASAAAAADRRLDRLFDVVEQVFALRTRIVCRLAVGILAAVEIDIGVDLIALVLLRTDKVGPGQRAGVEIDLAIAGDDAGSGKIGVAADRDVLVTGGIETSDSLPSNTASESRFRIKRNCSTNNNHP